MVLAAATVAAAVASIGVGTKSISAGTVLEAIFSYDPAVNDHVIVRRLRMPRTVVGLMVGGALGMAGAVMQAVTRNPLADPGILGVNAGASFAVVCVFWLAGAATTGTVVWFALLGAGAVSVAAYTLGSMGRGGLTPVRLTLAGAALSALLLSLTRAITLADQRTLDQFRFWAVGSLNARPLSLVVSVGPFLAVGAVLAVAVTPSLNALATGDDSARGLGVRVGVTRVLSGLAITLLCGGAVAAVGPVAFVGLVVPHFLRPIIGVDQRWLVPASALAGAAFMTACDTLGRIVVPRGEVQVGVMTAAVGGPAFVIAVRRLRVVRL